RYETTFVRERLVDAIAAKLGIDPNEVRRRNAISKDEMPYHRPLEALGEEIEHDSGDYVGLLDKLLAALDWDKRKAALARRRAGGPRGGRAGRRWRCSWRRAGWGLPMACGSRSTPRAWSSSSPAAPRSARASRP